MCFKHGPPLLTGVELEWLVRPRSSERLTAARSAAALGRHCPVALDPSSPADPLPGGSLVTVEPGGQIELASPPLQDLAGLVATAAADADVLHRLARRGGPGRRSPGGGARPPAAALLELPRYRAMEQSFDRIGPHGRSAMCSTAAVQVCVDAGERSAVAARWAALHALGPVLLAAFANSPRLHGRRTGWKSTRWAAWMRPIPRAPRRPPTPTPSTRPPPGRGARGIGPHPRRPARGLPAGAPPVQARGVRERREQHRAERVHGGPPGGDGAALPRVDATWTAAVDTWRCARAGRCGRTTAPSRGSEGAPARAAAGGPERPPGFDGEARVGGEAVQRVGVGGGGGEQPREIGKRRAGELDLAAGLHGDQGAAGQRIGGGRRVEGDRAMPAQRGGEHAAVSLPEDGGRTSHSSSTPVSSGGPCLKHTDAT